MTVAEQYVHSSIHRTDYECTATIWQINNMYKFILSEGGFSLIFQEKSWGRGGINPPGADGIIYLYIWFDNINVMCHA
jgi:hypothetical protein